MLSLWERVAMTAALDVSLVALVSVLWCFLVREDGPWSS